MKMVPDDSPELDAVMPGRVVSMSHRWLNLFVTQDLILVVTLGKGDFHGQIRFNRPGEGYPGYRSDLHTRSMMFFIIQPK